MSIPPLEVIPGQLYALGGVVEVDGRLSWMPPKARGYQGLNCFLMVEPGTSMIVDTGAEIHQDLLIDQLERVLPEETNLVAFLTRAERDCVGNLTALGLRFGMSKAYTGGIENLFDAFDQVGHEQVAGGGPRPQGGSGRVNTIRVKRSVEFAPGRGVELITPMLRLLRTFWAYDATCKTLFTSDAFGHTMVADPQDPRLIDHPKAGLDADLLRDALTSKFEWVVGADGLEDVQADLSRIFEDNEVEVVAPVHGSVLRGSDVVRAHYQCLQDVLGEFRRAARKPVPA